MTATAIHFGTSGRELFGIYHAAEVVSPSRPAVLLCNPFGQEAVRAHRIYRILAERLARAGHNVMRFDYYATGDSDRRLPAGPTLAVVRGRTGRPR